MYKYLLFLSLLLFFFSCKKDSADNQEYSNPWYSAMDISTYPEIATYDHTFYDLNNQEAEFLDIIRNSGVNTIRLRLWVNPEGEYSSLAEVKAFSQTLRTLGFKIWLTLHYSDTWADPGNQQKPTAWSNISFSALQDSVYRYTAKVVVDLQPEIIQIGNEVNNGMLHPDGHYWNNKTQFMELMELGIEAIRDHSSDSKIMIHFAGYDGADSFFDDMSGLDYDYIGLSYYPIWHGKSLTDLQAALNELELYYNKPILIAETAYPFTLSWNDFTTNIVGLDEQLILPEFPATPEGQKDFILFVKEIMEGLENGIGICYWGAEMIAWKGQQATDGSVWENQAVFNFNNKALPVLDAFSN